MKFFEAFQACFLRERIDSSAVFLYNILITHQRKEFTMSTTLFALLGTPLSSSEAIEGVLSPRVSFVWNPQGGESNWERYEAVFVFASGDPDAVSPETVDGWIGHPHLRVICGDTPDAEFASLALETEAALKSEECERKFLVTYPDLAALDASPFATCVHIVQTYIVSNEKVAERVRYRERNGEVICTHTVKRRIDALTYEEVERVIDLEEYNRYLLKADPSCTPVEKTRYCVLHHGLYFELDLYPFWSDRAIVELELAEKQSGDLPFPDMFRVLKEVTDDFRYKNARLAIEIPYDDLSHSEGSQSKIG